LILKLIKVKGSSLSPYYLDGDFLLVLKFPIFFRSLKKGDFVVFEHPMYGNMVKQVGDIDLQKECISVNGFHEDSLDSRLLGTIPLNQVKGIVIWHIRA
jgi:signal peptidase I